MITTTNKKSPLPCCDSGPEPVPVPAKFSVQRNTICVRDGQRVHQREQNQDFPLRFSAPWALACVECAKGNLQIPSPANIQSASARAAFCAFLLLGSRCHQRYSGDKQATSVLSAELRMYQNYESIAGIAFGRKAMCCSLSCTNPSNTRSKQAALSSVFRRSTIGVPY